jgi:hypothetical protein
VPIYDGVVTLDQTDVPVIVELNDDYVRLSASGTEIGNWSTAECQIAHIGDTAYTITAEDETLHFVPNQPGLFAAAINGGKSDGPVPLPPERAPVSSATGVEEAPAPKPLTMGLFYALCLTTAALALWSLISIVF